MVERLSGGMVGLQRSENISTQISSSRKKFTYPHVALLSPNSSVFSLSFVAIFSEIDWGDCFNFPARGNTLMQYSPSSGFGATEISGTKSSQKREWMVEDKIFCISCMLGSIGRTEKKSNKKEESTKILFDKEHIFRIMTLLFFYFINYEYTRSY